MCYDSDVSRRNLGIVVLEKQARFWEDEWDGGGEGGGAVSPQCV